jgi:hypothetical protein
MGYSETDPTNYREEKYAFEFVDSYLQGISTYVTLSKFFPEAISAGDSFYYNSIASVLDLCLKKGNLRKSWFDLYSKNLAQSGHLSTPVEKLALPFLTCKETYERLNTFLVLNLSQGSGESEPLKVGTETAIVESLELTAYVKGYNVFAPKNVRLKPEHIHTLCLSSSLSSYKLIDVLKYLIVNPA